MAESDPDACFSMLPARANQLFFERVRARHLERLGSAGQIGSLAYEQEMMASTTRVAAQLAADAMAAHAEAEGTRVWEKTIKIETSARSVTRSDGGGEALHFVVKVRYELFLLVKKSRTSEIDELDALIEASVDSQRVGSHTLRIKSIWKHDGPVPKCLSQIWAFAFYSTTLTKVAEHIVRDLDAHSGTMYAFKISAGSAPTRILRRGQSTASNGLVTMFWMK